MRAEHPGRRVERGDPDRSHIFGRQRRVRHLARTPRPGAGDPARQCAGVQQRARRDGSRSSLQLRGDLPAAVGRARRRGRADPGQPGPEEGVHRDREDRRARCARDPRHRPGERHRHLRRQLPGRGRCMEPGSHRRRTGRRRSGGGPAQRLDCDLLQLRQFHHHHRHLSAHGGLGHHHADLQRQGRLHPFRRPRVRVRAGQRCAQQGRGALRRAGGLLRIGRPVHQAGGGVRGRALEGEAHARGRARRRDGGRRGRCREQRALVHGEVRRGRHLHARRSRCSRPRAPW